MATFETTVMDPLAHISAKITANSYLLINIETTSMRYEYKTDLTNAKTAPKNIYSTAHELMILYDIAFFIKNDVVTFNIDDLLQFDMVFVSFGDQRIKKLYNLAIDTRDWDAIYEIKKPNKNQLDMDFAQLHLQLEEMQLLIARADRRSSTKSLQFFSKNELLNEVRQSRSLDAVMLQSDDKSANKCLQYFHQSFVKNSVEEWKLDAFLYVDNILKPPRKTLFPYTAKYYWDCQQILVSNPILCIYEPQPGVWFHYAVVLTIEPSGVNARTKKLSFCDFCENVDVSKVTSVEEYSKAIQDFLKLVTNETTWKPNKRPPIALSTQYMFVRKLKFTPLY